MLKHRIENSITLDYNLKHIITLFDLLSFSEYS